MQQQPSAAPQRRTAIGAVAPVLSRALARDDVRLFCLSYIAGLSFFLVTFA